MEMQILMQFHNLEEKLKKVAIVINIFFRSEIKKIDIFIRRELFFHSMA